MDILTLKPKDYGKTRQERIDSATAILANEVFAIQHCLKLTEKETALVLARTTALVIDY